MIRHDGKDQHRDTLSPSCPHILLSFHMLGRSEIAAQGVLTTQQQHLVLKREVENVVNKLLLSWYIFVSVEDYLIEQRWALMNPQDACSGEHVGGLTQIAGHSCLSFYKEQFALCGHSTAEEYLVLGKKMRVFSCGFNSCTPVGVDGTQHFAGVVPPGLRVTWLITVTSGTVREREMKKVCTCCFKQGTN